MNVLARADGSGTPIRVGASTETTRWSHRQRLFYLDAPQGQGAGTPSDGVAIGSIKVLDPSGGDPAVVIDGVDAYAPFDLH